MRIVASLALLLGVLALALPMDSSAQGTPALTIVSPAADAPVTTDDIEVQVEVTDFTLNCEAIGAPAVAGEGLIHALVDGTTIASLTGLYCEDTFTISGEGLAAGEHTLTVVLSDNNHADIMETAQQVTFDFQPANVQPLPEANDTGVPAIELVSPTDGATVDSVFTVEVSATNFTPTANLEGKQNVPGYGHYHVVVTDPAPASPEGTVAAEAAGIPGLIAMPGENTFEIDLTGWGPGEHSLMIAAAQNDHTGYEGSAPIEFTVIVN
jgi:hypothetical protein